MLNNLDPTGIIDLGSYQIKFIIFSINNSEIKILSRSILKTEGVKRGIVTDLDKLSNVIKKIVSNAEEEAKLQIQKIYLSPSPLNIFSTSYCYSKNIGGYEIEDQKDVQFLINSGVNLFRELNDKCNIIHLFNLNFQTDKINLIDNPIGLVADSLESYMHLIFCKKNFIKNLQKLILKTYLKLERIIYAPYALGLLGHLESQLSDSIMILDFGHEKTSISIFKNDKFIFSATVPLGSWHITNDISKSLNLNLEIAEYLKITHSYCDESDKNLTYEYIDSDNFGSKLFKKVSNNILNKIVNSRTEEIIDFINKELFFFKVNEKFFNKILITGEGSKIKGFESLLKKKLAPQSLKVEKFSSKLKSNLPDNYDVCLSVINLLHKSYKMEVRGIFNTKKNFFEKFFSLFD